MLKRLLINWKMSEDSWVIWGLLFILRKITDVEMKNKEKATAENVFLMLHDVDAFPVCLVFPLYFPERKGVQGKHITQKEPETERK